MLVLEIKRGVLRTGTSSARTVGHGVEYGELTVALQAAIVRIPPVYRMPLSTGALSRVWNGSMKRTQRGDAVTGDVEFISQMREILPLLTLSIFFSKLEECLSSKIWVSPVRVSVEGFFFVPADELVKNFSGETGE